MAVFDDLISDITSLSSNINAYMAAVEAYLVDPTQPLPDTIALIDNMTFDNLYQYAVVNQLSSNLSDHGAVTDVIERMFGIQREISLRGRFKGDFYTDGGNEMGYEQTTNSKYLGLAINSIRGRNVVI